MLWYLHWWRNKGWPTLLIQTKRVPLPVPWQKKNLPRKKYSIYIAKRWNCMWSSEVCQSVLTLRHSLSQHKSTYIQEIMRGVAFGGSFDAVWKWTKQHCRKKPAKYLLLCEKNCQKRMLLPLQSVLPGFLPSFLPSLLPPPARPLSGRGPPQNVMSWNSRSACQSGTQTGYVACFGISMTRTGREGSFLWWTWLVTT